MQEAEKGTNGCALPGAVWAEESEEFTLFDFEINGGERLDFASTAVVLGERTSLNGKGVRHGASLRLSKIFLLL